MSLLREIIKEAEMSDKQMDDYNKTVLDPQFEKVMAEINKLVELSKKIGMDREDVWSALADVR